MVETQTRHKLNGSNLVSVLRASQIHEKHLGCIWNTGIADPDPDSLGLGGILSMHNVCLTSTAGM